MFLITLKIRLNRNCVFIWLWCTMSTALVLFEISTHTWIRYIEIIVSWKSDGQWLLMFSFRTQLAGLASRLVKRVLVTCDMQLCFWFSAIVLYYFACISVFWGLRGWQMWVANAVTWRNVQDTVCNLLQSVGNFPCSGSSTT